MVDANLAVGDECIQAFQQLKMSNSLRYIIYKVENRQAVVIEKTGPQEATYADLLNDIPQEEPRFIVIDFPYETDDGRKTSKILFIFWSPDDGTVQNKMIYASSKGNLRGRFEGIFKEIQATKAADLEESEIKRLVS